MGYEGFSRPLHPARMYPIVGNKGEFFFLIAFFLTIPCLLHGRKKNEDGLRREIKTTNRYAELNLDASLRQPSKWTE